MLPNKNSLESELRDRIEELEEALRQIAKGEGPFSRDPLTHAANCVENMQKIAIDALQKVKQP